MHSQTMKIMKIMIAGMGISLFILFIAIRKSPTHPNSRNTAYTAVMFVVTKISYIGDSINSLTNSFVCSMVKEVKPLKLAFEITNRRSMEAYSVFIPRKKPKTIEEEDDCVIRKV